MDEENMNFSNHVQWIWYLIGALMTLVWKWQRFCYQSKGTGIPFWTASKNWFELVTVGSQMSWAVTIGIVWAIGAAFIDKVGTQWIFGGVLLDMPTAPPFAFLMGALAEMTVPALAKWLCSKIPFANQGNVLGTGGDKS
jgi:hypothetical protein